MLRSLVLAIVLLLHKVLLLLLLLLLLLRGHLHRVALLKARGRSSTTLSVVS